MLFQHILKICIGDGVVLFGKQFPERVAFIRRAKIEVIEHRVLKEHGFRSCLFPSTETGCIVKIYFAAGVAAMRKPTVL